MGWPKITTIPPPWVASGDSASAAQSEYEMAREDEEKARAEVNAARRKLNLASKRRAKASQRLRIAPPPNPCGQIPQAHKEPK